MYIYQHDNNLKLMINLQNVNHNYRIILHYRSGRHLVSGCHDGAVSVWDTSRLPVKVLPESDPLLKLVMKFKAHRDCVNGVRYEYYM